MSNGAQASGSNPTYRVVRELGKRAQRSWAAVREKNELVVIQRFTKAVRPASAALEGIAYDKTGAAYVAADAMGILLRDARCLSKNWHPNVSRVRHVDLVGEELTIATELVDGVTFADLVTAARAKRNNEKDPVLQYPLLARIIVDVLGGLHGLHGLRDGMNATLNVCHGELSPANIVVGKDGVARVAHVFRARPVKIEASSEGLGYAAPEALGGETSQDARADIYSVGAMLWEGLTGRRLFDDSDPKAIAQKQREEDLAPPNLPASSAFARLSEVAMRALAFDPALRFRTASEMATEIRRIAGTRLAPGSAVAQTVMELAGERIRARRTELDPSSSGSRRAYGAASVPPPAKRLPDAPPAETPAPASSAAADPDDAEPTENTLIEKTLVEKTIVDEPSPMTTRGPSERDLIAAKLAPEKPDKAATRVVASPAPSPSPPPAVAKAAAPKPTPSPSPASAKKVDPKPAPKPAPKPREPLETQTDTQTQLTDLMGPRGSDPNIVEVPLAAPTAAALARAAAIGKANADALAVAASKEVTVAEKSLSSPPPPPIQPPPQPFALTPSAAPPALAKTKDAAPVIVLPPLAPLAPFPLSPSSRPPAMPPRPIASAAPKPPKSDPQPIGPTSDRIDVGSVDLIEATPDLSDDKELAPPSDPGDDADTIAKPAPPVADARESGGAEAGAVSLESDDASSAKDAELAARRKKLTPIFAAAAGAMVLVLIIAGIASSGSSGSKDAKTDDKSAASADTSASAQSPASTATSTSVTTTTTATTAAVETATPPPTPAPAPTPTEEPAPAKVAATPPPDPAPAPRAPDPPPRAASPPPRVDPPHAAAPPPPAAKPPPAFVAPAPRPTAAPATPPKKPKKTYEPSGI